MLTKLTQNIQNKAYHCFGLRLAMELAMKFAGMKISDELADKPLFSIKKVRAISIPWVGN